MFSNAIFWSTLDIAHLPGAPNGNWTHRFQEIASALSLLIQGPLNANATNITAQAYGEVIFVEVSWLWMVVPLTAVIMSCAIFAATVMKNRSSSYLFKTSILAVLFHGLRQCQGSEPPATTALYKMRMRMETEMLGRRARKVVAGFSQHEDDGFMLRWEQSKGFEPC
ncbi:hypothetical protein NX059_011725 [Plenodomus lindquistii]|nr:hypothetical protein NX059_011725 [Plenodomus lindquistii]